MNVIEFFDETFVSINKLSTFASSFGGDVAQLVEHRTENP